MQGGLCPTQTVSAGLSDRLLYLCEIRTYCVRDRYGTMGHRTSVGIWLQGGTFSLGNDGDYESARIFLGACHYVVKRSYKVKKR